MQSESVWRISFFMQKYPYFLLPRDLNAECNSFSHFSLLGETMHTCLRNTITGMLGWFLSIILSVNTYIEMNLEIPSERPVSNLLFHIFPALLYACDVGHWGHSLLAAQH